MFFKKKTPKSASAKLVQEMASIADQSMANAKALRTGRALSPINHVETETLFSETNASGQVVYNHYHFTEDMTQIDPKAQIHLMRFFGQVIAFNELLDHPDVQDRLDWITANASFFERFFARIAVSTDIYNEGPEIETNKKMQAIKADDRARMEHVLPSLFKPDTFNDLIPSQTIPFAIVISKPFEEGQQFINGVYFSAQTAPGVMAWLSSLQKPDLQDNTRARA